VGAGGLRINGGKTVAGLTNIWTTDLGDIDILQGNISFQRRTALGNPTNTITIWPGASLDLFSLNQALPVPTNRIVMTNGTLRGTGADGDLNTFGGKITLNGTNNLNIELWTGAIGPTLLNLDGPIVGLGSANYDCGNSVIRLSGANTYSGNTSISNGTVQLAASGALAGTASIMVRSNGILDVTLVAPWTLGGSQTLAGSGMVNGEVMVDGTLSPGASAGTLTFSSTLTLAGSANMEVGKFGGVPTSDLAAVASTLTQGGELNVSLLPGSETLAVNDEFTLFTAGGGITDAFTTVNLPGGYTWDTSTLATDGKIKVLSVTGGAPTITYSFTGGSISLNWTGDYLGWHLEAQTNSLAAGLTPGGWYPVPGSDLITSTNIVVDPANPTVFYRLVAP
jgi:autotransporter-associated beta strand protein